MTNERMLESGSIEKIKYILGVRKPGNYYWDMDIFLSLDNFGDVAFLADCIVLYIACICTV